MVVTPEQLLALPDSVDFELVRGSLVRRLSNFEASEVAVKIACILGACIRGKRYGHLVGADASYQCFSDDALKVRKPDVSFVRAGRFMNGQIPKGNCTIAPDLVVEVISPKDLAYAIDEKSIEYLDAGVPLIWIVSPMAKNVRVLRSASQGGGVILTAADVITGEDVIPGFSCTVGEFFAEL